MLRHAVPSSACRTMKAIYASVDFDRFMLLPGPAARIRHAAKLEFSSNDRSRKTGSRSNGSEACQVTETAGRKNDESDQDVAQFFNEHFGLKGVLQARQFLSARLAPRRPPHLARHHRRDAACSRRSASTTSSGQIQSSGWIDTGPTTIESAVTRPV
jgi:hypothetical protein